MTEVAKHSRRPILTVLTLFLSLVAATVVTPVAARASGHALSEPEVVSVADGFIGPLGLAVSPAGDAYVVEAFAGTLTKIDRRGERTTLYTADQQTGVGLAGGVALRGNSQVLFTTAVGGGPEGPAVATNLELLRPHRDPQTIASLLDYEETANPDADNSYGFLDLDPVCLEQLPDFVQPYEGIIESNPYAVADYRGGAIVADAAGNSVIRVSPRGEVSTLAVLPPVPQQVTAELAAEFGLPDCVVGATYSSEPVPTDVEVGRDGYLYVSSLPGGPEALGNGSVFKIDPRTGDVDRIATGFLGATDLAVARDGTVYVADLFAGTISEVKDGTVRTLVELPSPGAVEIDRRGDLYATTGVFAEGDDTGGLVKIILGKQRR